MARSWKCLKLALIFFLPASIQATEIKNRFAAVGSFKDDRYVSSVNDNFRRLTKTFVADGDFNVLALGTSTIVKLSEVQTDTDYGIFISASWISTGTLVMDKTIESFKVEYTTPTVAGKTFDWILVR